MSRRVRLGPDKDGNFALKVALAGHDSYTEDDTRPNIFSYSSNWNDMVKPHAVGVLAAGAPSYVNIAIPALGYTPFVECHGLIGATFYDDRLNGLLDIHPTYLRFIRDSTYGWAYVVFDHA